MTRLALTLAASLILAACAAGPSTKGAADNKYQAYCKTHARAVVGEADEEGRYVNCLHVKGRHEVMVEEIK